MKTIQAVSRYFPENCGGIQVHLSEILPKLQERGIECLIAASQDSPQEQTYPYKGTEVYRYPVFPEPKPEPNHGVSPHGSFEYFAQWVKQQDADLYHQHQWIPKCGLPHLRLAKQLGMATVVTIHLPVPICQRHTLMLYGKQACDGEILVGRCSYCMGVSSALPAALLEGLSQTPLPVSLAARGVLRRFQAAPVATALNPLMLPTFIRARQQGLWEMVKYADRIIAVCQWLYDVLLLNGIPEEKLVLCRYGISYTPEESQVVKPVRSEGSLKVGFLGRWSSTKGLDVLVKAVKLLPENLPIECIIYATPDNELYQEQVTATIDSDPRIQLKGNLSHEAVYSALAEFDVLAVPSQWLETGPLVVLEAHAVRVPVIGSNLGGIVELVKHNIDGLLVEASNVQAWADVLTQLVIEPSLLNQLRQGINIPVRSTDREAGELAELYASLVVD